MPRRKSDAKTLRWGSRTDLREKVAAKAAEERVTGNSVVLLALHRFFAGGGSGDELLDLDGARLIARFNQVTPPPGAHLGHFAGLALHMAVFAEEAQQRLSWCRHFEATGAAPLAALALIAEHQRRARERTDVPTAEGAS